MSEENKKKPFYKKWWVWVIVVFVVIGITQMGKKGENTSENTSEKSAPQQSGIPISAFDYYEAYESNEVAADAKYKGKLLEISGVVESVSKTFGSITVQLKGAQYIGAVDCGLEDEAAAANLNKGDRITLIGKGDGKSIFPEVDKCVVKK